MILLNAFKNINIHDVLLINSGTLIHVHLFWDLNICVCYMIFFVLYLDASRFNEFQFCIMFNQNYKCENCVWGKRGYNFSFFLLFFNLSLLFNFPAIPLWFFTRDLFISPQVSIGYRVIKSSLDTVRYWWWLNGSSNKHTLTLVSTHTVNPQPLSHRLVVFWCSGLTLCLYVDFLYF